MQADRWSIVVAQNGNKWLFRNGQEAWCFRDMHRECNSSCVCFQPVLAHKSARSGEKWGDASIHAVFIESMDLVCCGLKLPIHEVSGMKDTAEAQK